MLASDADIVEITECKLAVLAAIKAWRRALSKHNRVLLNLRQTQAGPAFAAYLKAMIERHQQQSPVRDDYINKAIQDVGHGTATSV